MGEIKKGDFGIEKGFWIVSFGVIPALMGKGIGHALADHAFQYCRSIDISDVYSVVRWDAGDLLSFSNRLGFDRSNFINLRKRLDD